MATSKNVDFTKVKDGGSFNRNRIPAGDYLATVTKIDDAEAKDGVFQYLVSIKINKHPSRVLPYYCKLQENQLWKLRNLLIAAGLTVPKKRVKIDPNKIVGRTIGVTIEDDEYDGKEQSTVAAVFPAAELMDGHQVEDDEPADDDEDLDENTDDVEDEPEEDEADSGDEFDALDRTELKALLKKADASFVAKKSQTDDDLRALLRAGSDDEDVEEDEEEEPAPAPKARPARAKSKVKSPARVDDEDLEELDIDDI